MKTKRGGFSIELLDKDFRESVEWYAKEKGLTYAFVLNRKAFFSLLKARQYVEPASETYLERYYGPKLKIGRKKGQPYLRNESEVPAVRIYFGKVPKERRPTDAAELYKEIRKFRSRRFSSMGYQRLGFNSGIIKFARMAKAENKFRNAPKEERRRSLAFPAKGKGSFKQRLQALFVYRLANYWGRYTGYVSPEIRQALRRGALEEMRDTIDHVSQKKLAELNKKAFTPKMK